jgi:inhibitor of KinA sporulation pathway (predicted exonuclease)
VTATIIIIDIEATCWKKLPPEGQQSEIIEIGVCTYDLTSGEVGTGDSILVKPTRSKVSPFCTKLTTLTQDMVDGGVQFYEACALLRERYATHERPWASWGAYDRKMFETQCPSFGVEYPFGTAYINLKDWYAQLELEGKRMGMAAALRREKLTLDGTHHRGGDDARNIARILASVLARRGVAALSDE